MNTAIYTRQMLRKKLLKMPVGTLFRPEDVGASTRDHSADHLQAFVGTLIRNMDRSEDGVITGYLFERIPQNGDLPR